MQSNALVWFIITNIIAVTPIAKAAVLSPDSLSLNADLFQVSSDDNSQEPLFSSNNNLETALNPDSWQMSSGAADTTIFDNNDDDFLLTLETSSTENLFASSCSNNILRRRNDPSSCETTDGSSPKLSPDLDLLQKFGQGDLLYKLLDTPPGSSQQGSELLEEEEDDKPQKLLDPYDPGCDPDFPKRLCCDGPPLDANPAGILAGSIELSSIRSMIVSYVRINSLFLSL